MKIRNVNLIICLFYASSLSAQANSQHKKNEIFWKLSGSHAIVWDTRNETRLPHSDNIEMSGQNVAAIITYDIDKNKNVRITRDIIFPQLRVFINSSDPFWRNYRAYLRDEYTDIILPKIVHQQRTYVPGPIDSVRINGTLQFFHEEVQGLKIIRTFLPSMSEKLFMEKWRIINVTDSLKQLSIGNTELIQQQVGLKGVYKRKICSDAATELILEPHAHYDFGVYFSAYLNNEPELSISHQKVVVQRDSFLNIMKMNLVLESPVPILNTLFYFSKVRAAESIYQTKMGLVHSPGGGRYYSGVWANDQAEYSGPFFPYLGYDIGNKAALNAYRMFKKNIPQNDGHFWSSFEMEGDIPCCGADRGDAAMIAFGASQYALVSGKREIGNELWPLIEWSLDYCKRQKNAEGVIRSDTDEMEDRIPTGTANLSTSSLYYGALSHGATLADALDKDPQIGALLKMQAAEMEKNIEIYFGAHIEGLNTYRYFKEHNNLRHWICLPLVMGIENRKDGTLEALFSRLWTNNGVRVEYNPSSKEPNLFWDRGTLYAFRGAFRAGAADRAMEKLQSYSETRLLGFHVPYVVEAWPEGNMAHLSAESALYCRIFTEGLLGIEPSGFDSFTIRPHLPSDWNNLNLKNLHAFNTKFDILINREEDQLRIIIINTDGHMLDYMIDEGSILEIKID